MYSSYSGNDACRRENITVLVSCVIFILSFLFLFSFDYKSICGNVIKDFFLLQDHKICCCFLNVSDDYSDLGKK